MSLRRFVSPFALVGALALAGTAQAQIAPTTGVMDAEGRVFGNAVPMPPLPAPQIAAPLPAPAIPHVAPPMAAPLPQQRPMAPVMAPPAQVAPVAAPGWDNPAWQAARADWLDECRRRYPAGKKSTTLGAVLGGVVGGVIGNRVAGRGNRTVGTVAGAVVGGVAGGAIGNSADRNRSRDYCESYLEDYLARQQQPYGYGSYGYAQPGVSYGYAMQPVMMMVPVMMMQQQGAPRPQRECKETIVTEEWVPVKAKRRVIHRPVPDKRVRIVPDKRVRIN